MVWVSSGSATPRSQWEPSSGSFYSSASMNCGPTCASFIAGYYHDGRPGIENTRRLVTTAGHPTTYQQQADMLTKRNVPAVLVDVLSLDHLERLVKGGRRPVILAIDMSRVPYVTRGYSFAGYHSIVAVRRTTRNGVRGWILRDPNFTLKSNVRRFYSDAVLKYAFIDNWQSWAVVPHDPKRIAAVFDAGISSVNIRTSPSHSKANVYAVARHHGIYRASDGKRIAAIGRKFNFTRTVSGDGWRWARVHEFGRTLYIRRQYMHLVSY